MLYKGTRHKKQQGDSLRGGGTVGQKRDQSSPLGHKEVGKGPAGTEASLSAVHPWARVPGQVIWLLWLTHRATSMQQAV